MKARFRVIAMLEFASRPQVATVEIDRASGLVTVRPLRAGARRCRTFSLAECVSLYFRRLIAADVAERKRARKKRGRR